LHQAFCCVPAHGLTAVAAFAAAEDPVRCFYPELRNFTAASHPVSFVSITYFYLFVHKNALFSADTVLFTNNCIFSGFFCAHSHNDFFFVLFSLPWMHSWIFENPLQLPYR
jgi:hypothetical protein